MGGSGAHDKDISRFGKREIIPQILSVFSVIQNSMVNHGSR